MPYKRQCVDYAGFGTSFDGATNYATRGANLTGISSGKKGTVSFRYLPSDNNVAAQSFLIGLSALGGGATTAIRVLRLATQQLQVTLRNAAVANIGAMTSTATFAINEPFSLAASWDLGNNLGYMLLNGVPAFTVSTQFVNDDISYATPLDWGVGGSSAGGVKIHGCMEELFFHTDYIDLRQPFVYAKFFDNDHQPVNKGAQAERIFGTVPLLYMPRCDGVNYGTGGNFTFNGTRVQC